MALSCQEHLNILGCRVENRGELRGSHDERLMDWRVGGVNRPALVAVMEEKDRSRTAISHCASEQSRLRVVSVRARAGFNYYYVMRYLCLRLRQIFTRAKDSLAHIFPAA